LLSPIMGLAKGRGGLIIITYNPKGLRMGTKVPSGCTRTLKILTTFAAMAFFAIGLTTTASAQSISYDLYGYRANEGGGGAISTPWTKGNLGNTWAEGEWVPYQFVVENPAGPAFADADSFIISFDFTRFGGGGAYFRFVDLIRSIQVGTVQRNDDQGWVQSDGSAFPDGTREQIEIAQNDPDENEWTGFTLLNLPQSQINLTLGGALDTPPGEDRHIFYIKRTDLPVGLQNASTLVFYWQLHESRTFVWANSLQEQYDQSPTDDWGGYLYGTDGWPNDTTFGSGYVPGSSGHIHLEDISGSRDVPIPIPERLPGSVDGLKFLDADGDSTYNTGDSPLPGWRIFVSGEIENIMFETSVLTDGSGNYSFPSLTAGTWYLSEADQREVPAETGYMQTYTNAFSPDVGVGSAYAFAVPGRGPWGWEVQLSIDTTDQGDLNFGNKLCEITCTDPPDVTIECTESSDPSNTGWPTVDYNCGPVDTSYSDQVSGSCPTVITRTWTFTDDVGNTSICDQIITVQDTTAPVVTCPPDTTFNCVMGDAGTATATDNCDSDPLVTSFDNVTNARCPYVVVRGWVATDSCGNADTCYQTITVQDVEAPVIACPPDTTFECDAVGSFGFPTATDNCDPNPTINEISRDSTAGCGDTYSLVIGYEAVDSCGNADTCYQNVAVVDTTPPQITCPSDKTFECDNVGAFGSASATDNCDDDVTINEISRDSTAGCGDTYSLVIGYEAIDDCGNADTCYQNITVQDTTPPQITCPPDTTFECDNVGAFGSASATDNCDPNPAISEISRDSTAGCGDTYSLVIGYEAMDNCGNADTCYQNVTVVDTTPPQITCPPDKTFECDNVGSFGSASATDNCDDDVDINEISRDSTANCGNTYSLVIGYEAMDDCGNADTCYQLVTVVDTTPPQITCPPDTTFECTMGDAGTASAFDNCDPNPTVAFSDTVITESCPRVIHRTWTATDDCSNSASCTQVITIDDTEAPTLTCAPDFTITCSEEPIFAPPTADDNCDTDPLITMVYTDIPDGPGVYARGWIATDFCGNVSDTCYQTITVEPCPCTFTIGGWGSTCPGSDPELQPGCIRDNYWDVVFGDDSVTIGHPDGFTAKWSSPLAVENFLPNGSTPGVLDQNYVDPLETSAGVLASQILALKLNVAYSCAGVFSSILGVPSAGDCYGDALVPESCANGLFSGYTVDEFLAVADSVVAGLSVPGITPSDVNYTATCLNEFADDCDPFAAPSSFNGGKESGAARLSIGQIPTEFSLDQNYPNPFNPVTEFSFGIPVASHVTLKIYNITGQEVTTLVDGYHEPGMYTVQWNGTNSASGVYFYRIEAKDFTETRKMLLLK
jgi:hypothetical protein